MRIYIEQLFPEKFLGTYKNGRIKTKVNKGQRKFLNGLREAFKYSDQVQEFLESKVSKTVKGKMGGKRWQCAKCGGYFGAREIDIDHIDPIIPLHGSLSKMSVEGLIRRVFGLQSRDSLMYNAMWELQPRDQVIQLLCKTCHRKKSKEENVKRRECKKRMEFKWKSK
jgi:hypothetical protein